MADIASPVAPNVLLSLVVPVHNDAGSVEPFLARAKPVLADVAARFGPAMSFEVVFVDDGSTDGVLQTLRAARSEDPRIRIVSLSRRFGKETALAAGFAHASGMAAISMDVDLQDPPEIIPELVDSWLAGYDIVNARRLDRSAERWTKRKTAGLFPRVFNWVAERPIPPGAGDYRLVSREVMNVLNRFPERARYMQGLFAWIGFPQCSVDFVRPEPQRDGGKWRYWRLWNSAVDGITSSTTLPLRLLTTFGAAAALLALAAALGLALQALVPGRDVPGFAPLAVLVLFFGGINLLSFGMLGEYLARTYTEVKGRPLYIVRHAFGFADDPAMRPAARGEPLSEAWPGADERPGSPVAARSLRAS